MLFPSGFRSINRFYDSCAKRLVRLVAKCRRSSGERLRAPIAMRVASVTLVLCLLSSSTPAAPETIVVLAKESSVGFLFWFRASGLAKLFQGQGVGNSRRQEKQSDRNARVARIELFPGDVTVSVNQHVQFAAIAEDKDGAPIGGVQIKWSVRDEGRNTAGRISPHGDFEARIPGTFKVIAEGGGRKAHVKVTVSDGLRRPGANDKPTSPVIEVSNREGKGSARVKDQSSKPLTAKSQPTSKEARRRQISSAPQVSKLSRKSAAFAHERGTSVAPPMPQSGGGGWNDGNFRSSSDPINLVGDPPGAPMAGGAGSSNFQFAAPIAGLAARGISISLGATFNGRVWNKSGSEMTYDIDRGWPAPGWSLGFGKLLGMGVYNGGMLVDADGTRHSYTGTITPYNWGTTFVGHTTDGSFIDYNYQSGTGGPIVWARTKLANGTVIQYGAMSTAAVYPTSILDAQGNWTTITYVNNSGPRIQTISDTMGRVINFSYDANNLLTAITAPGLGGGTRTLVRFHYRQLSLNPGFSGMSVVVRDWMPWVVDAIYYPATSTGYWFGDSASTGYLFGNSDSYSSYGMLAKVVEVRGMTFSGPDPVPAAQGPTGQGTITSAGQMTRQESYNYPLTPDYSLTDGPTYTTMTDRWTPDGSTTMTEAITGYEVHENDNPRKTIITLPNGTKSKQLSFNAPGQYNDGLGYHDVTFVSDENSPLQSSYSYWEQGA